MIAQLRGKLLLKTPTQSVIDCGGVGYEVNHTPFTAESFKGPEVSVFVHTHVKEDIFQLYAFQRLEERSLFRELIKVSSVGPKLALSILSGIPYEDLILALQNNDIAKLQKIPGIGKKTAQRMAVELADRLLKSTEFTVTPLEMPRASKEAELESVLMNLGYQRIEISKAVTQLKTSDEEFSSGDLQVIVKKALGFLSKKPEQSSSVH